MNHRTPPDEPRMAHYLFAHRALPRAFLRDPAAILGILSSADSMRFLDGMWDVLDRELEPDPRSTPHTLELACYVLPSDVFVALVTMPPPQRVLEAFFVALVARLEGASAFARCFTLDLARAPSPGMTTPRGGDTHAPTGILEWDMRGQHTLVKESVAPEASCFVEAIERLIESDLAHA